MTYIRWEFKPYSLTLEPYWLLTAEDTLVIAQHLDPSFSFPVWLTRIWGTGIDLLTTHKDLYIKDKDFMVKYNTSDNSEVTGDLGDRDRDCLMQFVIL